MENEKKKPQDLKPIIQLLGAAYRRLKRANELARNTNMQCEAILINNLCGKTDSVKTMVEKAYKESKSLDFSRGRFHKKENNNNG